MVSVISGGLIKLMSVQLSIVVIYSDHFSSDVLFDDIKGWNIMIDS